MFDKTKLRKFMPLFVVAILATIFVAQSFAAAPEIKDGYYQLGTKEDLEWFRDTVNSGSSAIKGKLTADIDLKGSGSNQWTAITGFSGIFDGDGHTISNLYINDSSKSQLGLFGTIAGATIKNVTVTGEISGGYGVAGIVGVASGNNTIDSCHNKCNIQCGDKSNGGRSGGVCGIACEGKTTIKNCSNSGNVSGDSILGGILGVDKKPYDISGNVATIVIENCSNSGNVTSTVGAHTTSCVGGIVGNLGQEYNAKTYSSTISNCSNTGKVSGNGYEIGGIVGRAQLSDACEFMKINDCVNKGVVEGTGTINIQMYVGGICGSTWCRYDSTLEIKNCTNTAAITCMTDQSCVGGIVGRSETQYNSITTLSGCDNSGTINGITYGAIAGVIDNSAANKQYGTVVIENTKYLKTSASQAIGSIEGDSTKVTQDITAYDGPAKATISPDTQEFYKSEPKDLIFTVSNVKELTSVQLNGADVEYSYSNGSLTLKKEIFSALTNGNYTLSLKTDNGDVSATISVADSKPSSGGGGGGCNAGFGALALLVALPMIYRRKK